MPETITIHSASARDIVAEETKAIAEDHERTGAGVTWFEVLRIVLIGGAFGLGKTFAEEVTKKIADIVVEWARFYVLPLAAPTSLSGSPR